MKTWWTSLHWFQKVLVIFLIVETVATCYLVSTIWGQPTLTELVFGADN